MSRRPDHRAPSRPMDELRVRQLVSLLRGPRFDGRLVLNGSNFSLLARLGLHHGWLSAAGDQAIKDGLVVGGLQDGSVVVTLTPAALEARS